MTAELPYERLDFLYPFPSGTQQFVAVLRRRRCRPRTYDEACRTTFIGEEKLMASGIDRSTSTDVQRWCDTHPVLLPCRDAVATFYINPLRLSIRQAKSSTSRSLYTDPSPCHTSVDTSPRLAFPCAREAHRNI